MDVCATACLRKSEGNLWGSGLSFHSEGLGNGLKSWGLVMLGDKPLNHRVVLLSLSQILIYLNCFIFYLFIWCVWRYVCV